MNKALPRMKPHVMNKALPSTRQLFVCKLQTNSYLVLGNLVGIIFKDDPSVVLECLYFIMLILLLALKH